MTRIFVDLRVASNLFCIFNIVKSTAHIAWLRARAQLMRAAHGAKSLHGGSRKLFARIMASRNQRPSSRMKIKAAKIAHIIKSCRQRAAAASISCGTSRTRASPHRVAEMTSLRTIFAAARGTRGGGARALLLRENNA